VQYCQSRPPQLAEGQPYLDYPVLIDLMSASTVVVSHGGPTTISEARRAGHRPLVVPRRASLGEHVDDHQVRFTDRLARSGLIDVVDDAGQLAECIEQALRARALTQAGDGADRADEADPTAAAAAAFAEVVEELVTSTRRKAVARGPIGPSMRAR
jgi:UDP-N-acetylglucosamine transferase subunit ALG13